MGQGPFKLIENGADRPIIYDLLLVWHCNYSSSLLRFRVIAISWSWNI